MAEIGQLKFITNSEMKFFQTKFLLKIWLRKKGSIKKVITDKVGNDEFQHTNVSQNS